MVISTRVVQLPTTAAGFQNLRPESPSVQRDEVSIGPPPPVPPTDHPEEQARSTGLRVAAGVGLALVMAGLLTGCGGDKPADPPGQTTTVPTTLSARIQQLVKDGKQTEARQLLTDTYYHQVLTRLAAAPEARVAEWAQKGLAEYQPDGDPGRMNQAMQSALQQIAGEENMPGAARRYQEVARSALRVGESLEATPLGPAGIFDQVKAEGFKAALGQVLTLPQRVDQNASGMPRDAVKAYLDTLTDLAQISLDTGQELGEPGLQAAVYQSNLTEIKTRIQTDGEFLGSEVQKLVELIGALQH